MIRTQSASFDPSPLARQDVMPGHALGPTWGAQRYSQTDEVVLGLFAIGLSGLLIDALLRTTSTGLFCGAVEADPRLSTLSEGTHRADRSVPNVCRTYGKARYR